MLKANITEPQSLLAWLNLYLMAEYNKIEHLGNGAAYCQLMDMLFPQAMVPMRDVHFSTTIPKEARQNFNLLSRSLKKMQIHKVILMPDLIQGNYEANLSFLRWFKELFDKNYTGRKYDVVAERNGCRMGYIQNNKMIIDKAGQGPEVNKKFESKSETKDSMTIRERMAGKSAVTPKTAYPMEEILETISMFYSKPKSSLITQKEVLDAEQTEQGTLKLNSKVKTVRKSMKEEVLDTEAVTAKAKKLNSRRIHEKLGCSFKNPNLTTFDEEVEDMERAISKLQSDFNKSKFIDKKVPEVTSKMVGSLKKPIVMAIQQVPVKVEKIKENIQVPMPKKGIFQKDVVKKPMETQKNLTAAQGKPQRNNLIYREPTSLNYLTKPQQIVHLQREFKNSAKTLADKQQEIDLLFSILKDIEKTCLEFDESSQVDEVIQAIKKSISEFKNSVYSKY